MMGRIWGWAKVVAGAAITLLSILSITNFAFEWDFLVPPSVLMAAVVMLGGAALFVSGLMALDTEPRPRAVPSTKPSEEADITRGLHAIEDRAGLDGTAKKPDS